MVSDYPHSRKDEGISDAFNAGVALSRGKYVALVNSDDWLDPNQMKNAIKILGRKLINGIPLSVVL